MTPARVTAYPDYDYHGYHSQVYSLGRMAPMVIRVQSKLLLSTYLQTSTFSLVALVPFIPENQPKPLRTSLLVIRGLFRANHFKYRSRILTVISLQASIGYYYGRS